MKIQDKWFKAVLLLLPLFFIIAPHALNPSTQYSQFEKLDIINTYSDFSEGSWVFTLELKSSGTLGVSTEKIFVLENEQKIQVFVVSYVDYKGNIFYKYDLREKKVLVIPDGEYGVIQFKVPEEVLTGEYARILLESRGGMEYYKSIPLVKTTSVDINLLSERLYNAFFLRYKIEYASKWMPLYILLCIYFGVFLDGYLKQRNNPIVYDGYLPTRYAREYVFSPFVRN